MARISLSVHISQRQIDDKLEVTFCSLSYERSLSETSDEEKRSIIKNLQQSRLKFAAGTTGLGLGMDLPGVSTVMH